MKTIVQPVKGTRDFYPDEMAVRAWLLAKIRKVSEMYGYQEYEGPFLERLDLYAAKSGDELVNKQSYVFEDRGGDKITLRPEMTPTLARMIAQKQKELVFPARWWMFGPFWRYEQPQKGRTREFFQWNIDLLGANTPECDAEILAAAVSLFREVGLRSDMVRLAVNSRRLMDSELAALGITGELKSATFRAIDRREKMAPAEWADYAVSLGLSLEQVQGVQKILTDRELWKKSDELVRVVELMAKMGMAEDVVFDPTVIRGLDYYTGIVFEAHDVDGGRAIFGGGHYDNLVGAVGGDPLPGVGFAMGDVMFPIVLEKYGLLPRLSGTPAETLVTVFDEASLEDAFLLSAGLRASGLKVVVYPEAAKLQKQLKYADRIGVRYVIIAGPDERAAGQVTIKDLQSRTQETIGRAGAAAWIRERLAQAPSV